MLTQQALVSRRPIENRDKPLLRELFESSRDELDLLPQDVRYLLIDEQFRAQRKYFRTTYPNARHDILVVDGHDVGRLVVDESGPTTRIIDITVRRSRRGQHIATTVLEEVIADAHKHNRSTEMIIWTGNAATRQACERLGFGVTREDDGYLTMKPLTAPQLRYLPTADRPDAAHPTASGI